MSDFFCNFAREIIYYPYRMSNILAKSGKGLRVIWLILLLLLATVQAAWAQTDVAENEGDEPRDSVFVSILTCAPGVEAYDLYGHTALRICDTRQNFDRVYNYGIYSFNQPNFVWHFILGETDYTMMSTTPALFMAAYAAEGRSVSEQVLQLTPEQVGIVARIVYENECTPNWTYRYRYSDDNCTTRVINAVHYALKASGSRMVLPDTMQVTTYREMIRRYAAVYPWTEFSDDLLMGAELDRDAMGMAQLFLPQRAAEILQGTMVQNTQGEVYPLVRENRILVERPALKPDHTSITPMIFCVSLLVLMLLFTYYEMARQKNFWVCDAVLLAAQGLAGCIITFLFFFSQHPGMDSNWLVLLLNPLPLLLLWPVIRSQRRGSRFHLYFYAVNGDLYLILLLIAALNIQDFPRGFLYLAGCLLIRALKHVITGIKKIKETKKNS